MIFPEPLWITWVLVLGAICGSFLNVVIWRLPRRQSLVKPGSRCPACKKPIRWWANIPLLSFLALRGKCAACGKPIHWRYPAVEAITAALFLAAWWIRPDEPLEYFARTVPFLCMLVAVTGIDLEHRIIPNRLNLFGALLGVATLTLDHRMSWVEGLAGGVLGFGLFYGFAWTYERLTGRRGLGGGDVKLLGVLGLFAGPEGIFGIVLLSSVIGSIVGISVGLLGRRRRVMKVAIPFGPFLAAAAVYVYLAGLPEWLQFSTPT